jgi:hypothetical protein
MKPYDSSYRVKCPFCARLDKCYDPVRHDHTCGLCHMTFDVERLESTGSSPSLRLATLAIV